MTTRMTMDAFYCDECGQPYSIDHNGVSRHTSKDGDTDYDADFDHVPYGEEPVIDTPNDKAQFREERA